MCGRFTLVADQAEIHERFGIDLDHRTPRLARRYNIAPTQTVAVVGLRGDRKKRGLALLKWGLVPHFSSDGKPGPTNARGETVDRLPSFRESFRDRRCIIPADGFYEWLTVGKRKVPHRFTLVDNTLMGLAGIWDVWQGDGAKLLTCCLITTSANETVAPIHDRMPVILPPDLWQSWLDPDTPVGSLTAMLRPYSGSMVVAPASPLVNKAGNEGPELLAA